MTPQEILDALREVKHPAKGEKSIVELEMVQNVELLADSTVVTLAFGRRRDPLAEYLIGATRAALVRLGCPGPEVRTVVVDEQPAKTFRIRQITATAATPMARKKDRL